MKIILSRKGFDSSAGGCASPIFEDGSYFSLPIPQTSPLPPLNKRLTFSHINFKYPIGKVVEDLTQYRIKANDTIHFDPDLRKESLPRQANWRGLFGQASAAQTHLAQHGIGPGDIFLFFGWFREVEKHAGIFRFKRGTPDRHVLFGWLEVGEIWKLGWIAPTFPTGPICTRTSQLNSAPPTQSTLPPTGLVLQVPFPK